MWLIERYDPTLVLLSVMLAVQGAYVSLVLAKDVIARSGLRRRVTLGASAFALGTGIWTMHFVGMLALKLPVPVDYDVLLTLVSALAAILAVGVSVALVAARPAGRAGLALASVAMGAGISTMHYIGMAAMRVHADVVHDPPRVLLSVVVAVGASWLSLSFAFGRGRKPPLVAAAVTMALAISGMHYTAMWAAGFREMEHPAGEAVAPAIPGDALAIVVAVIAFLISAAFLLMLVPDGRTPLPQALPRTPAPRPVSTDADPTIPVLKNGATILLRHADILYVEADAHYTHLFDGTARYFCNHSISEVERRLDPARFIRVHRSHIVRKEAIVSFRRSGSHGLVTLSCDPPGEVPVSRSRLVAVQQTLGV